MASRRRVKLFLLLVIMFGLLICIMITPFFQYAADFKLGINLGNSDIIKDYNSEKSTEKLEDFEQFHWDYSEFMNNWWNLDDDLISPPNCDTNATLWNSTDFAARNYSTFSKIYLEIKNCKKFKKLWKYPAKPISAEEANYPLGYVFMGYRNLGQTLRLFRAIYQPQNVYCINWDSDSTLTYRTSMKMLEKCFPNVLTPKYKRKISWGQYSLLQSTMDCLKLLKDTKKAWNYVQIVSWNDFPLKTNRQMVQIFKILNGTTDSDLAKPFWRTIPNYNNNNMSLPNAIPPHGLHLFKSTYVVMMPRKFVNFLFENEISRNLFQWINSTYCSEEIYFSTLIHNVDLNAPGNFPGACLNYYLDTKRQKHYVARYQVWKWHKHSKCYGYYTHGSCVYGYDDVHVLKRQKAVMAHKLYEEFQPAALYCLEKWHYENTIAGTVLTHNEKNFYSNMKSVRYNRLSEKDKANFVC